MGPFEGEYLALIVLALRESGNCNVLYPCLAMIEIFKAQKSHKPIAPLVLITKLGPFHLMNLFLPVFTTPPEFINERLYMITQSIRE